MIYPYPIEDEPTTHWFTPLIDWCIINTAANKVDGRVFVGRKVLKERLAVCVANVRKLARIHSTNLTTQPIQPSSTSSSPGQRVQDGMRDSALPKSTPTPSLSNHDTTANIPYELMKKKTKALVGDPPAQELIFDGGDNYLQWRVTILEKLEEYDGVPNRIQAEAILLCIKGPTKATIKRKVSREAMCEHGAMAIIDLLDQRFKTSLALRSLDTKFDELHQEPGESLLSYATRFENLLYIKECSSPEENLKDATIIRHFTRGIRDAGAMLSATLVDPLKAMDFHTYKDSLLAVCDDMPHVLATNITNAVTGNSNRPKGQSSKPGKQSDDPDVVAICLSSATDLGLSKDACLRCGQTGHLAANCRADSNTIVRLDERCRRCGCLKTAHHRCNPKKFVCARCKRRHHLAGICLKTFGPVSAANTSVPQPANGLSVVRTAAANVSSVQVGCSSSVASLLHDVPEDPTINLRFGKDPHLEYCEVPGLIDTGANVSLLDRRVFNFLYDNHLVTNNDVHSLPTPARVTSGNHTTVDSAQVLKVNCCAGCTTALKQPVITLTFLLVPDCNPRVIIGRNMFSSLGIQLRSDQIPIPPHLGCRDVSVQTTVTSADCPSGTDGIRQTFGTSPVLVDSRCSRAVTSAATPLIDSIVDNGQRRLCAHLPAIENANIYPYRASKRRRPPTDDAIIHGKLLQMCQAGKVLRAQDKDVTVVCQPVLIDKCDRADGASSVRTYPVTEAELKRRYRLTIDCRPLPSYTIAH